MCLVVGALQATSNTRIAVSFLRSLIVNAFVTLWNVSMRTGEINTKARKPDNQSRSPRPSNFYTIRTGIGKADAPISGGIEVHPPLIPAPAYSPEQECPQVPIPRCQFGQPFLPLQVPFRAYQGIIPVQLLPQCGNVSGRLGSPKYG